MRTPSTTSSGGDPAALGALGTEGDLAAGQHGREQVGQRSGEGSENASARPGTANHAASPVSHRLTSAPAATAEAAP